MSRRYKKRRRHGFLKFLLVIFILGAAGTWLYVRYYPGGSVDKLEENARQAKELMGSAASKTKEVLGEKLKEKKEKASWPRLKSTDEINLRSSDGYTYYFTYQGEDYRVVWMTDTWKIYDSYKITNLKDIKVICQALTDIHPVPSRDWTSYRTPEDMAAEWDHHNKIYLIAPEGGRTKERTRSVDLDPEDQGKSYIDLYNENLGTSG